MPKSSLKLTPGKSIKIHLGLFIKSLCMVVFMILVSCNYPAKETKKTDLIPELKEMYFNDQKYRRLMGAYENDCDGNYNFSDERALAQKLLFKEVIDPIDLKNTERLIEITKTFGFPGMERLHHDIPIFMVFVHSPKKYFPEIKTLINKEFKLGHITEYGRDYIFWHLKGRKGNLPNVPYSIYFRTTKKILIKSLENDKNSET